MSNLHLRDSFMQTIIHKYEVQIKNLQGVYSISNNNQKQLDIFLASKLFDFISLLNVVVSVLITLST